MACHNKAVLILLSLLLISTTSYSASATDADANSNANTSELSSDASICESASEESDGGDEVLSSDFSKNLCYSIEAAGLKILIENRF
jgi:hypothetical protein